MSKGEGTILKINQAGTQVGFAGGLDESPIFRWNKKIFAFALLVNEARHLHCVTENCKYICGCD